MSAPLDTDEVDTGDNVKNSRIDGPHRALFAGTILLAAVIISTAFVLANLHKMEISEQGAGAYRINTVTGAMWFCVGGINNNCRKISER